MRNKFKLSRVAVSVAVAITGLSATQLTIAGSGFTDVLKADGKTYARKQTFFAYSPSGPRDTEVPEGKPIGASTTDSVTNLTVAGKGTGVYDANGKQTTGTALRKFVDPLPLPGAANAKVMADGTTSKYIPVAVASKWINPQGVQTNDDYYEIAIVEYAEKFHSDLKKATKLRGYVQLDHFATFGGTGSITGSKAVELTDPSTGLPLMVNKVDPSNGKLIPGQKVVAKFVDNPHFLGPVIAATKNTPTRLKVHNLLPVGRADVLGTTDPITGVFTPTKDANGQYTVTSRNGDLFLPVDKSILGAGVGPDGVTEYTQNRASVHLHGGDTPWISDGTPHQWITPAGENDINNPKSLAAAFNNPQGFLDPSILPSYLKGVSTQNVPDMNDPGEGAMTLYYPNGHTARMEWYHDHTFGSTRLNVYAGMASAYLLTDDIEQGLINDGTLPPADRTIPLVMQDRTFVPDDIALQDAHWNTTAWGEPGDSWFPHVYETVQDPAQANNWNAVGRWHYGPWFWPVFPALYNLPDGSYSPAGETNTVTTTPEGWNDTAVVNGVAYPTLEVDPTTYRFRVLNASNDRMMTFNLFEATDSATLADGTISANTTNVDSTGVPLKTELNMVPAAAVLASQACPPGQRRPEVIDPNTGLVTGYCTPETWPTDGRIGGVPNPASVGPTIYQIANESGWLPKVAAQEPTPVNYLQDKGRITVLNVDLGNSGLYLAPAERADLVIDFSAYAGKTLLVYNDSGAPVPAGDPRNDLFTGVGDQSGQGGAEDTKPGYGPNTRTMMQIKVKATTTATATPVGDALNAKISAAYFSDETRRPIVAQDVYSGFSGGADWANFTPADQYGDIYLGSLKNPTFTFTPGTPSTGVASVLLDKDPVTGVVTSGGAGYLVAPDVLISDPAALATDPTAKTATAVATMKIDAIKVTNPGKGYTSAPLMSFSAGGGNGAMANAFLSVDPTSAVITKAGKYGTFTGNLQVIFTAAPGATVNAPAGVTATGYATVSKGLVTGIVITNPGSGYTAIPLVNIVSKTTAGAPVSSTIKATATVTGVVNAIVLYGTDNTTPAMNANTSGGGGYTDLRLLNVNIRGGLPVDPATGLPKLGTVNAVGTATGKVSDITLTHPGSGYTSTDVITVTVSNKATDPQPTTPATATATAAVSGGKASYLVKTKTIQELFDPTYGRLNATLGVELPFTSALTQTTLPLGYVDETTEQFAEGETQIWKITHNGVDSHPVHFHLLDVQVINRVGWDGFIQPIEPKEMGWKETVMMSPLEDIIVAVRPKKPALPAGIGMPLSKRLMDPTQPEGSPFGFTQIDPAPGNPTTVTNAMRDYGWEYVWHCHILGHEENDFMRPIKYDVKEAVPAAPELTFTNFAFDPTTAASVPSVNLTFLDHSDTEYKFSVRRTEVDMLGNAVNMATEVGALPATAYTGDLNFVDAPPVNQRFKYAVAAVGGMGESLSAETAVLSTYFVPAAVNGLTAQPSLAPRQVTLAWTAAPVATGYTVTRSVGGVVDATFTIADGTATGYVDATALTNVDYLYTVTSVNGDQVSTTTTSVTATIIDPALKAPNNVSATVNLNGSITIGWVDQSTAETRFQVQVSTNGGAWTPLAQTANTLPGTSTGNAGSQTVGAANFTAGNTYQLRVVAQSRIGNTNTYNSGSPSTAVTVVYAVPTVPGGLNATATRVGTTRNDTVVLNWTASTTVANQPALTGYTLQYSTSATFAAGVTTLQLGAGVLTSGNLTIGRGTGATANPSTLYYRVLSKNVVGNSAYANGSVPLQ